MKCKYASGWGCTRPNWKYDEDCDMKDKTDQYCNIIKPRPKLMRIKAWAIKWEDNHILKYKGLATFGLKASSYVTANINLICPSERQAIKLEQILGFKRIPCTILIDRKYLRGKK